MSNFEKLAFIQFSSNCRYWILQMLIELMYKKISETAINNFAFFSVNLWNFFKNMANKTNKMIESELLLPGKVFFIELSCYLFSGRDYILALYWNSVFQFIEIRIPVFLTEYSVTGYESSKLEIEFMCIVLGWKKKNIFKSFIGIF